MKHPTNITLLLLGLFLLSQLIGLLVLSQYLVASQELPLGLVMPDLSGEGTVLFILISISIGTIALLALIRFNLQILIRLWMFISIATLLTVSFSAFIDPIYAILLSVIFAIFKVIRFNVYLHNLSELFMYGALAVLFSPILSIEAAIGLLIIISVYDMIAVWKSRHMVYMAKGLMEARYFPGIAVPYNKASASGKTDKTTLRVSDKNDIPKGVVSAKIEKPMGAILGGGDMAFPLIFSGVVFQGLLASHSIVTSLLLTSIIPVFATLALAGLFAISKKDRFYPAMPFVSVGGIVGYLVILLI
jgi:presenilin-like A22 family membrane protease